MPTNNIPRSDADKAHVRHMGLGTQFSSKLLYDLGLLRH
jgi:hypothetical protein